ncbi:MAG: hypothetical protein AB8B79_12840 [Granulosicoccus sp.]
MRYTPGRVVTVRINDAASNSGLSVSESEPATLFVDGSVTRALAEEFFSGSLDVGLSTKP